MTQNLLDQFPTEELDRYEESRLVMLAKSGDESAAVKLVMSTMRRAILYTHRTSRNKLDEDILVSLCYEILMKCVMRYDPSRRTRFFAFSKAALRGHIKTYWKKQDTVRNATEIVSVDELEGWLKPDAYHHFERQWPKAKQEKVQKFHPSEDDDRLESYREPITGEIEPPAIDAICVKDRWHEIEKLVRNKLNERQRMVICLTYVSGLNFPEIGKMLNVTRSMIHAIHRQAIQIIRNEIARDGRLLTE